MGGRHSATERSRPGRSGAGAAALLRGLVGLLALAAVGFAVALAGLPAAVGGSALTVLSPSMQPTLAPGDVVVVRPRPASQIGVGDVVTFTARDPQSVATRTVTHRVTEVLPGPVFRTKGDANATPDPLTVPAADVHGVLWYSVPLVGGLVGRLMTPAGAIVGVGLVVLVLGALLLVRPARP
jgi:signal peptidase I